jgi:hypothetical protein
MMTRPYRLRVVPSSPERLVARLRELSDWVCWFELSPDNPIDCRRDYLAMYGRCARLLIRWQMWADFHAGVAWAPLVGIRPDIYAQFWEDSFGNWPGDDVARGQMEDE